MKAEWIEIKRGDMHPQNAGMHITLNLRGHIVMSRVTYELIGGPAAFQLLYDKPNNRIGLKPTALASRNAYPARVFGSHGAKVICALRLLREQRIKLPNTVEFPDAEIDEDNILILDLRTATESMRAKKLREVHSERRSLGGKVNLTRRRWHRPKRQSIFLYLRNRSVL